MSDFNSQRARLKDLLAESRRLVAQAEQASRELDQLWAARKDARRRGQQVTGSREPFPTPTRAGTEGRHSSPPAEADENSHILLLVEDSLDDFMLFKRAVHKAGIQAALRWARTGAEALHVLSILDSAANAVCVVMDVKLPDMTGFQLLEAVRRLPHGEAVHAVVLTGNRQPGLEERARSFGAEAFFLKPCEPCGLTAVARALEPILARRC
jgi:CheY-like chemotaxis protein